MANKILRYKDTKLKTEAARVVAPGDIGVVLEELDWNKIKRNKKWSSKCQKADVGKQREYIVKRAKSLGIPVMMAPQNYASTQICSSCGAKQKLTLKDRVYKCPVCGLEIDRDLNASKNLANLWGSSLLKPYKEEKEKEETT